MIKAVILFVVGLVLICLGGDRLVDAAVLIAKKMKIPQMVVGATIVSLGTTLPEILVSSTAAFSGSASIAAGNAFGSIICNTALIAGLTQLIKPTPNVEVKPLRWRSAYFGAVLVGLFTIAYFTKEWNQVVGVILLVLFCAYAFLNIKIKDSDEEEDTEESGDISLVKQLIILVVCAGLLYVGANLLVDNGILIAQALGVPERVIAVTFIALGTSLPELVTSVVSLIKGYANVGFGNIIGANTLNMLLVMGIPAAVAGIKLETSTIMVDIPLSLLVMSILIVPILIRKKSSRIQGVLLLAIYVAYCVASFV